MTRATFRDIEFNPLAGKRGRLGVTSLHVAMSVWITLMLGCASLKDREQIIRVRASRDSAEAARLTLVGVKALHYGDVDRATTKFLDAVDADDTYGPAHNNLGLLHYERGDLFEALMAFERAMELMPQDPAVYYNQGLTLESAGKVHEAMDLYWQAVEMDPTNPNFLGNLVRLRIRLGESDPTVVTQLQDLILIETRPQWRRWADRQLALTFNPALDRGPDAPEFDPGSESESELDKEALLKSKIIELSPSTKDGGMRAPWRQTTPSNESAVDAESNGDRPSRPDELRGPIDRDESKTVPRSPGSEAIETPTPIRDDGSLDRLPTSIGGGHRHLEG